MEIHRLPALSNATLSGQEIGETFSLGNPPKYVPESLVGSPHTSSRFQSKRVAWGRLWRSVSSRT